MILFDTDLDPKTLLRLNKVIVDELELDGVRPFDPLEPFPKELRNRFPPWTLLQDPRLCERSLWELRLMAEDQYEHRLSRLQAYVLYRSIQEWQTVAQEQMEMDEDDEIVEYRRNDLENAEALEMAFSNNDFFYIYRFVTDFLNGGDLCIRMGVDLEDHLDLMPQDIRRLVEARMAAPDG